MEKKVITEKEVSVDSNDIPEKKQGPKKKHIAKKKKIIKKKEIINNEDILDQFGTVCKLFIIEHIRKIDFNDVALILDIKAEKLKEAVEKKGIKLPIDSALQWNNIDVGNFRSLDLCARCQVQQNHSSFFVGLKNCRKCYEKNIKNWIEKDEIIKIIFPHER